MPNLVNWITVEPSAFLISVAIGLTRVANTKLIVDRTCKLGSGIFGNGTTFSDEVCDNLDSFLNVAAERVVAEQVGQKKTREIVIIIFDSNLLLFIWSRW